MYGMNRKCVLNCDPPYSHLYGFPSSESQPKRRKLWLEIIGKEEETRTSLFLCERHFSKQNFSNKSNLSRLKYSAVPDQNLKHFSKINEEKSNKICHEKFTQTGTDDFQDCGTIRHFYTDNTYFLICYNCSSQFELCDWELYLQHLIDYNCIKIIPKEKEDKKILLPQDTNDQKCSVEETCVVLDPEEFMPNKLKSGNIMMDFETVNTDIIEINSDNKAIEINSSAPEETFNLQLSSVKVESAKPTINDDTLEIDSNSNSDFNFQSKELNENITTKPKEQAAANNEAIIDLEVTESKKVLQFLTTFRNYPILWHSRKYFIKLYDEEANKFLKEFPYPMKYDELRLSLEKVHSFHRRYILNSNNFSKMKDNHKTFQNYIRMIHEIVNLAQLSTYACDQCPYIFSKEPRLMEHKYNVHGIGDVPFICSNCGLHFETLKKKEAHEISAHNFEPKFSCKHCDLLFLSQNRLEIHMSVRHPEFFDFSKGYKCKECDAKFARWYLLKGHMKKHQPKRFKCEICNKSYWSNFDYKSHMKTHTNKKDFICEICGMGFYAKGNLRKHIYRVHKIAKYGCEYCKTSFITYELQYLHNQKFHPNGTNLDRKKKLHKIHMKNYNDRLKSKKPPGRKKPEWKCRQCGILFPLLRDLQRHKREENHYKDERRYNCPHCTSILSSKVSLFTHLSRMHKLNVKYSDLKFYESMPVIEGDNDDKDDDNKADINYTIIEEFINIKNTETETLQTNNIQMDFKIE